MYSVNFTLIYEKSFTVMHDNNIYGSLISSSQHNEQCMSMICKDQLCSPPNHTDTNTWDCNGDGECNVGYFCHPDSQTCTASLVNYIYIYDKTMPTHKFIDRYTDRYIDSIDR